MKGEEFRYVINFGDMTIEEASRWADLLQIVRERVKNISTMADAFHEACQHRSPMRSANPPAVHVAKEVIATSGGRLQDQAIYLTTPVPKLVSISKGEPPPTLRALVDAHEPRPQTVEQYAHQAEIVSTLAGPSATIDDRTTRSPPC